MELKLQLVSIVSGTAYRKPKDRFYISTIYNIRQIEQRKGFIKN